MRLLKCEDGGKPTLTEYALSEAPEYAILSHTWGKPDEEVLFKDILDGTAAQKPGYRKLEFCRKQAAVDGIQYFWIDTCCIDKANFTELSEAINSMFRWYHEAKVCYAYLSDVSKISTSSASSTWERKLQNSRYFKRGWTLQELLAPKSVQFFSVEGALLGNRKSLENEIHYITKIPVPALRGGSLVQYPTEQRLSWSHGRQTTKEEDIVYCLLGIFSVHISLIYGEGRANAMIRLLDAIEKCKGILTASAQADKYFHPNFTMSTEHSDVAATETSHFEVPFGQNEDFVGRETMLAELVGRILPSSRKNDCQRTVVEGLGGVGKTQIALEAAYRVHDQEPECSVFWIVAMSSVTFGNSLRDIGKALGLPGLDSEESDVKGAVKAALERSTTNWLLIVDNIDNIDLVTGKRLQDYLPFSRKGSILFTTRNHEVAVQLDVTGKSVFSLQALDEIEALAMLQKGVKERQLRDVESTKSLLRELTCLPLAIKQASAYMARTGVTTADYLHHYLASDETQLQLLNVDFEDRWRYSRETSPITKTWLVSFNHLEQSYPGAAEYLKFSCFLAEKDVPVSLLTEQDRITRSEALGILEGYAFITVREDGDSFDIHRLIRLATRNWIIDELEAYSTKVIRHLATVYPHPYFENRQIWIRYLPHVEVTLQKQKYCTDDQAKGLVLNRVARSFLHLGKYNEAEQMARQAYEVNKLALGSDSDLAFMAMDIIAVVLHRQGKYDEAEKMHRELLQLQQTILGPRHLSTLDNLNNLAIVLRDQGQHDEAKQMHQEVLQLQRTTLGPHHLSTLHSVNNLANLLRVQGLYDEAEQMHRWTLQIRQTSQGQSHPDTLHNINSLANVLRDQGKYDEAEQMYREMIPLEQTILGPYHLHTLESRNNLGTILRLQWKYKEAEQMQREVLQIKQTVLGPHHPSTLGGMYNVGQILFDLGQYEEAEALVQESLELRKLLLGPDHPHTQQSQKLLQEISDAINGGNSDINSGESEDDSSTDCEDGGGGYL